jgi:hypothetical protein
MKPENELLAEEVAFVNTCEKMAEVLGQVDRGRHEFEIIVYGGDAGPVVAFGSQHKIRMPPRQHAKPPGADAKPLTLQEFDAIARDGEADLPPTKERVDLYEAPGTTPMKEFSRPVKPVKPKGK